MTPEHALAVCVNAAHRRGVSREQAQWFAQALVNTSLWGIDTHGLRLLPLYLRELDEGRSNPKPSLATHIAGPVALVEGDNALGTVAGSYAAICAANLARDIGVGVVSVRRSNHFGAASVYGDIIARQGMVGLVTTSAASRMTPFNGTQPFFGTNPICFSAPSQDDRPFVLDMATSQISYSQVKHYRAAGLELGTGWALDAAGHPTTKPEQAVTLAPLGGYKGQGLAMMVQILSALLAGMPLDTELEHLDTGDFTSGRDIGHFLLAIDPARLRDAQTFAQSVSSLMKSVREVPSLAGTEVLCPGDIQARHEHARRTHGIPLSSVEAAAFEQEEICLAALNTVTEVKHG
nr:Ldh family oxidoreductase [Azotobacter chroococcum]